MLVLFDNSADNPDFWKQWGDKAQDVLYLNEAAKDVLQKAGLKYPYSGTTDKAPENCGTMSRMPRYVNLH